MEGEGQGGGGGGGGPAPFLLKTYDMIDDSSTDDIVSWSSNKNSFVVWNPAEFSRLLLPTYFKHNNFSSFIRQLNTYGFRKVDPERWEFANEDFVKDQKNQLKHIHRRKPIHSHSQPHNSFGEAERIALEEEIERLLQEKAALQSELWRFKQQQLGTKAQLEVLERRVFEMEQRQFRMTSFLAKAVKSPTFLEHLIRMSGGFLDLSAINKKRRLPKIDFAQEVVENSFIDDQSSMAKADFGPVFHQDFFNKLTLELSPAVSDNNLISASVQSSTEGGGSPQKKLVEGDAKDPIARNDCLSFGPETLDLSDTGASFLIKKNSCPNSFLGQLRMHESMDEEEGHISCQLNLTLASSPLQVNKIPQQPGVDHSTFVEPRPTSNDKEIEPTRMPNSRDFGEEDATMVSSQGAPSNTNNQGSAATQGRVNDVFWEQFLTERPGSSDTEEASSNSRSPNYDDQEERKARNGKLWRNKKDMEQLTL
ncbi:heat stress transcription factor A-5-like [Aristolochia californica]|uniref:heat stress transcription factor A-5-like n=1 Tax=Aristolochia californica TaxID=171875 RepID=UPI0035D8AEAE